MDVVLCLAVLRSLRPKRLWTRLLFLPVRLENRMHNINAISVFGIPDYHLQVINAAYSEHGCSTVLAELAKTKKYTASCLKTFIPVLLSRHFLFYSVNCSLLLYNLYFGSSGRVMCFQRFPMLLANSGCVHVRNKPLRLRYTCYSVSLHVS